MYLATVLTVVGGLTELGGIGLVVREIREDRELARRHLEAIEGSPLPGFRGPGLGPHDYLWQRHQESYGPVDQRLEHTQSRLSHDVERTTQAAERAAYAQRQALVNFITELLQGNLGTRRWGAGLVAIGIVLSTTGSVLCQ